MPTPDPTAQLDAFWQRMIVDLNARHPQYHSWQPGRRNSPPSGKARREFFARQVALFTGYFYNGRVAIVERLLRKIFRSNGERLTERAAAIWRERWYREGKPAPEFYVTRYAKPHQNHTTPMADIKLSDEVKQTLRESQITDALVILPAALPRERYVAVNKALNAAGGRWKKGKGHVFQHGTQFLRDALESGVAVDRKKKHQFFPTPQPLTDDLAMYAHLKPGFRVLEPSAGDGAIVRALLKYEGIEITAVEIRPEEIKGLKRLLPAPHQVREADFLSLTPADLGYFDAIVMNPPFTRDQDIEHITHAYSFLKPDARLVSLGSVAWTHSLNRKRSAFAAFVQKLHGEYQQLGEMKFGTANIAPLLIFLDRPAMARHEAAYERLMAI